MHIRIYTTLYVEIIAGSNHMVATLAAGVPLDRYNATVQAIKTKSYARKASICIYCIYIHTHIYIYIHLYIYVHMSCFQGTSPETLVEMIHLKKSDHAK